MERLTGYYGSLILASTQPHALGTRLEAMTYHSMPRLQPGLVVRVASEDEWRAFVSRGGEDVCPHDEGLIQAGHGYFYEVSTD